VAHGSQFACSGCDYRTGNWLGRCPRCGAWGSLEQRPSPLPERAAATGSRPAARAHPYPELCAAPAAPRPTGVDELDRVLGGGLVAGAAVLIGGEPGIGKSTLLLQAASSLADAGHTVLYVSGEESASQLRLRGDRLGVRSRHLLVLADTDVDSVLAAASAADPSAIVVDSIQAVRCVDVGSVPGSVTQVRESASRLVDFAKSRSVPLLLVGHVTKDGSLAGPRVLEHLVDTVIQFEGDRHHAHRLLRALKNRFGATDELGVFRMTDRGLLQVASPSEYFLAERSTGAPGSAVLAAIEGTRPLLIEIQVLVGEPTQGTPRRTIVGVDPARVALVLAVLQRRTGVELANRDVFVNVTGGLRVEEPAADLAVAAAAVSSFVRRPLPDGWVVAGEVGLTGEVRAVTHPDGRLREAERLGFGGAVIPAGNTPEPGAARLRVLPVRQLRHALDWMFPDVGPADGRAVPSANAPPDRLLDA